MHLQPTTTTLSPPSSVKTATKRHVYEALFIINTQRGDKKWNEARFPFFKSVTHDMNACPQPKSENRSAAAEIITEERSVSVSWLLQRARERYRFAFYINWWLCNDSHRLSRWVTNLHFPALCGSRRRARAERCMRRSENFHLRPCSRSKCGRGASALPAIDLLLIIYHF